MNWEYINNTAAILGILGFFLTVYLEWVYIKKLTINLGKIVAVILVIPSALIFGFIVYFVMSITETWLLQTFSPTICYGGLIIGFIVISGAVLVLLLSDH